MLAQMKAGRWGLTVMKRRREPTEPVLPARIPAVLLRAETRVLPEMYAPLNTSAHAFVVLPAVSANSGRVCGKSLSLTSLHKTSACHDQTIS